MSLDSQALTIGNPIEIDGNVHKFSSPVLQFVFTKLSPKGTILLLPGGGYKLLKVKKEGEEIARFLNAEGFDVAILEYQVGSGSKIRNIALMDALKAFRFLKANQKSLGLSGHKLDIIGFSAGGHLAARTVQKLGESGYCCRINVSLLTADFPCFSQI